MVQKICVLTLFLANLLYCVHSQARDCRVHPTYCQIVRNHPKIDKDYAFKLSNIIYNATNKYQIPANIYTAILMQESAYKLSAVNVKCGLEVKNINNPTCIYVDFGISQVNYKTAVSYNMDIERLTTDLEYSVYAGAKVLSWFYKKYKNREEKWYVRYNCGTKKSINRKTCQLYDRHVSRWL